MAVRKLILERAMLPDGWAKDVALDIVDGTISAVKSNADRAGRDFVAGIAIPGLPNLHSHCFQRGMAGLGETKGAGDDSFWTWRQVMYGFLDRLTPDDVEAIAAQAMMDMLERGFTSLAEFHYLHHDPAGRPYDDRAELAIRIVAAAKTTGIGLTLLPVFYAHSGFGGQPPLPAQRRFINDLDGFAQLLEGASRAVAQLDDGVIGLAPHSLRAATPEELASLVQLLPTGPIHIHIAEQTGEVDACLAWSGQRPVAWLYDHLAVDQRWCLVHATHVNAAETQTMAQSGAVVGLCPITEANLGDGLFPAGTFLAAEGMIGVGSDSNVDIDAPGELRLLEYGQRLAHRGRNLLADGAGASTGAGLYRRVLAGGARALNRRIGVLAPGYRGDFVVLDGASPDLTGRQGDQWLDAYVFAAGRSAIASVWVAGDAKVSNGRHHARDQIMQRYKDVLARIL